MIKTPIYKNKCKNCGVEWIDEKLSELCDQCIKDEENKAMGKYEVKFIVTAEELNNAQYGTLRDMEHLADKVLEEAKKKGYEGFH